MIGHWIVYVFGSKRPKILASARIRLSLECTGS